MVIDSSALIAVHLKEPHYEELIEKTLDGPIVIISAPTLLETTMVLSAHSETMRVRPSPWSLRQLRVQIVLFTQDHFDMAADAFLRYGSGRHPAALNFGDCMSYAVAALSGFPLLYTGKDFAQTDMPAA